ncbi:cytidine/deoxycytidylate deaminase family protein [Micromonospora rubida]|uniref:dCMP deaminase n=1 Tax=Micromonospora rubida TaxID=2697657 RepID=UPI0013782D10|nr:dCMP deaminase [Micromonospora rubida]NBE85369.1 dCMP deaminase [Micromonospora rubida]
MTDQQHVDRQWLQAAIDLSHLCPAVETAYAVGAIIVDRFGHEVSRGFSRETDSHVHAEESALAKLTDTRVDLSGSTIYTSLEPCSVRKSRPRPCAELIIAVGITRVVLALHEPPLFVTCHGVELLQTAGAEVIEIPELADQVRAINAHLPGISR